LENTIEIPKNLGYYITIVIDNNYIITHQGNQSKGGQANNGKEKAQKK
jgi:hypothetical protein